jgi:hypothetical protein
MRMLSILALAVSAIAVAGCGTVRENRFNETAYADHLHYDHDVVYRSPAYGERYYEDDDDVVYVRQGNRLVAVDRDDLIYGDDGYYYYRD